MSATSALAKTKTYCGWVDNPTPANVWMQDRFGEITISTQGGGQAEGDLNIGNAYQYNIHYGAGCGCMKADLKVVNGQRIATKIYSSIEKPLAACGNDKSIPSTFRPITLIHSSGKAYTDCADDEQAIAFNGPLIDEAEACVTENNKYYYLAR